MAELPRMMTIPEIAKTGVISQYALRKWVRQGIIPAVYCGNTPRVNFDLLVSMLNDPDSPLYTRKAS